MSPFSGAVVFDVPVLINSPSGMFWMSMVEDLDKKRKMLLEYGVIDKEDRVVNLDIRTDVDGEVTK